MRPAVDNEAASVAVLRGRQIYAAELNLETALVGYLFSAPLTTALFYQSWGPLLLVWDVAVAIVCVVRLLVARRTTRNIPKPQPRKATRVYVAWCVLTSATFTSAPLWIQLHADGFTFAFMMALALGTFWCGCFVHSPLIASTVAFSLTPMTLMTGFIFEMGFNAERSGLLALFAVGTATALHVTRQSSKLFSQTVLQQLELEQKSADLQQQADVIGLLLKEHEDQSSDWLWQIDPEGHVRQPSSRFCEAVGQAAEALHGSALQQLLHDMRADEEADSFELLLNHIAARRSFRDLILPLRVNGSPSWWCVSGRPVFGQTGLFQGFRGAMADVTAAKLAEGRITYLARHDALTDLPNRAYFLDRLVSALKNPGTQLAVISVDLDGFKPVNDRYGHPVGDALLTILAGRLQANIASTDVVARMGGDEFAIKTRNCAADDVEALCRRLIAALSAPVTIGDIVLTVGASIGVAFAPTDGTKPDVLVKNADSALYRAKGEGRGTFRFFSPAMDQRLQERLQMVHDLRLALARNEFHLHYQPFVDAETGRVTGCEALLRWTHPQRGSVSPAEFVPIAEESGLVVQIGAWVLEEACRQAASWGNQLRVAVNLSPVQFRDNDLPERVLAVLRTTGLSPSRLELEVTETVLVNDANAALHCLRRIRALGVRIALDDFGTGYSSLSYLRRFPFDKIKIDRCFVSELGTRHDSLVIVQAIRDIARGLGMTITAEGVETVEQAEQLRLTGCQELQGYLFSRPKPPSELIPMFGRCLAA